MCVCVLVCVCSYVFTFCKTSYYIYTILLKQDLSNFPTTFPNQDLVKPA